MASQADELDYVDTEWFAVDSHGKIGYFTTGGASVLPESAFATRAADHEILMPYFCGLPVIGDARVSQRAIEAVEKQPASRGVDFHLGDWIEMARRGLYAYDVEDPSRFGSAYILVAEPSVSLDFKHLPQLIQAALLRANLSALSFATARRISVDELS